MKAEEILEKMERELTIGRNLCIAAMIVLLVVGAVGWAVL